MNKKKIDPQRIIIQSMSTIYLHFWRKIMPTIAIRIFEKRSQGFVFTNGIPKIKNVIFYFISFHMFSFCNSIQINFFYYYFQCWFPVPIHFKSETFEKKIIFTVLWTVENENISWNATGILDVITKITLSRSRKWN